MAFWEFFTSHAASTQTTPPGEDCAQNAQEWHGQRNLETRQAAYATWKDITVVWPKEWDRQWFFVKASQKRLSIMIISPRNSPPRWMIERNNHKRFLPNVNVNTLISWQDNQWTSPYPTYGLSRKNLEVECDSVIREHHGTSFIGTCAAVPDFLRHVRSLRWSSAFLFPLGNGENMWRSAKNSIWKIRIQSIHMPSVGWFLKVEQKALCYRHIIWA